MFKGSYFIFSLLLIPSMLRSYIVSMNNASNTDQAIVSLVNSEGIDWKDDLTYLTYISMDEIGAITYRTYPFTTISLPGFYRLAGNVSNAISITTSNVTLDLNGNTVSGGTNGIVVNSALENVTIRNGTVSNVTSDGIQINAGCRNITLKDLTIKNAVRGINFEAVTDALIRNCDLNSSTTGMELDTCQNIYVENCVAQANTQAGYSILSSTTCTFFDCKAISTGQGNQNVSGNQSFVYGFVSRNGNGHLFEQCIANGTENLSAFDFDTVVAGFALLGTGTQCHKIINCEAANSTSNIDGYTTPYGIYLEPNLEGRFQTSVTPGATSNVARWSPDGKYVALGLVSNAGTEIRIYEYDRVNQQLILLDGIETGQSVFTGRWSPDGRYFAVVMTNTFAIYRFDKVNQVLEGPIATGTGQTGVAWHHEGRYIATGTPTSGVPIYEFDREAETLTLVHTISTSGRQIESVEWRTQDTYVIALGYGDAMNTPAIDIYQFNPTFNNATFITSTNALSGAEVAQTVNWSPDANYLVGGGGGGVFIVFRFNGSSLATVASFTTGGAIEEVAFSPNGRHIAVASSAANELQIFYFDRNAATLSNVRAIDLGSSGQDVSWSPDGDYLVAGSNSTARIFSAYNSPSGNVIQGNVVYGNTSGSNANGCGISGSSNANYIIQNKSYDQLFGYFFATNVFNQLFGDAPTLLQNIALKNKETVNDRIDFSVKLCRLELLAESLIDNLL